jgi:hypothetical protein
MFGVVPLPIWESRDAVDGLPSQAALRGAREGRRVPPENTEIPHRVRSDGDKAAEALQPGFNRCVELFVNPISEKNRQENSAQ